MPEADNEQKSDEKWKLKEQNSKKLFCKVISLTVLNYFTTVKSICFRRIQRCESTLQISCPKWTPYVPLTLPFKSSHTVQKLQSFSEMILKKRLKKLQFSYNCLKIQRNQRMKLSKIDENRGRTCEGQTGRLNLFCQERIRKARQNLQILKLKKNLIQRGQGRTFEVSKYS